MQIVAPAPSAIQRRAPTRRGWAGWIRLRHGFVLFATLVLMGVHLGLNSSENLKAVDQDRVAPLLHALVLAGLGVLILSQPMRGLRGLGRAAPFWLFPTLTAASCLWSVAPLASATATASLLSTLVLAALCWSLLGTGASCRIQVQAMIVAALASLAAAMLVPGSAYDIGDNAGALRGVFTQKNQLGEVMLVGLTAWSYLVLREQRLSRKALLTAALALVALVLSRSVTALLLSAGVVAATGVMLLHLRRSRLARPVSIAATVVGALLLIQYLVDPAPLFALVGKKPDITGRGAIWQTILTVNGPPSLLGAGYSAFWSPDSSVAQVIWDRINFVTQSAHNGYLQTRLEIGNLGLLLLLALFAATIARIARVWLSGGRVSALWALLVLAVIAVFNIDEVSWPRPDMHLFQWVLAYLGCRTRLPGRASLLPPGDAVLDLRTEWVTGGHRGLPPLTDRQAGAARTDP